VDGKFYQEHCKIDMLSTMF